MKDKFYACCADLGLINGGESWENGCILPGCKLDEPKLTNILMTGTKDGANCHRELYSWSVALSDVMANPFVYDYGAGSLYGKFDLTQLNEEYFVMLSRFGYLVNKYRGTLIFDPYDECGVKNKQGKPKRTPFNPWTNNKQGIKGWWDPKAAPYCRAWEDRLVEALKDVIWIPTIGNELTKRCVEQGQRTLKNFQGKGFNIVYHGMLHNTKRTDPKPPWFYWHKWQKKNWHLDEHVGEVWHLKGTIAKIKKMGNDHKEIPVEPRCFFSIDGINDQEMSKEDVLDILAPLYETKDTGKSKMFFKKKPIIEVLNYSNKHITRALNTFHKYMFGVNLSNYGKVFDDAPPVRPPDPAPPIIEPPVDVPEEPGNEELTKPIITYQDLGVFVIDDILKEGGLMKNIFDFENYFKQAWAPFKRPISVLFGLLGLTGLIFWLVVLFNVIF